MEGSAPPQISQELFDLDVYYGGPYDFDARAPRHIPQDTGIDALHRRLLYSTFRRQTSRLDVAELASLAEDRTKLPRNIDDFDFAYTIPKNLWSSKSTLDRVKTRFSSKWFTRYEYSGSDAGDLNEPNIDAAMGVGLRYRKRFVAVCAGGIAVEGPIIMQLQDVSAKEPEEEKYKNGLHSGIDWKTTLVNAWHTAAQQSVHRVLPAMTHHPTWIQSAVNNRWANKLTPANFGLYQSGERYRFDETLYDRFIDIYDETAQKLGAERDPLTRNFVLPSELQPHIRRPAQ